MNQILPIINIIACGALAKELFALKSLNQWQQINITCIPAKYHNTPALIPDAVEHKIIDIKTENDGQIFVAYGDCGTGGLLDSLLEKHDVKRLPGAHCYQFFAGQEAFEDLQEDELGTYYLTDFLASHFDNFVWKALGLDRHPELLDMYFSNYKKLIYLAQTHDDKITDLAREGAKRLNLKFERIYTGYGDLDSKISEIRMQEIPSVQIPSSHQNPSLDNEQTYQ
ncbi:MAG: hypothetical protein COA74_01605 [Gammaproteobacteria bacterium]|nr:MAG: hypothetical protein COA74_01605 [Gammaproteobacteria bacterium]